MKEFLQLELFVHRVAVQRYWKRFVPFFIGCSILFFLFFSANRFALFLALMTLSGLFLQVYSAFVWEHVERLSRGLPVNRRIALLRHFLFYTILNGGFLSMIGIQLVIGANLALAFHQAFWLFLNLFLVGGLIATVPMLLVKISKSVESFFGLLTSVLFFVDFVSLFYIAFYLESSVLAALALVVLIVFSVFLLFYKGNVAVSKVSSISSRDERSVLGGRRWAFPPGLTLMLSVWWGWRSLILVAAILLPIFGTPFLSLIVCLGISPWTLRPYRLMMGVPIQLRRMFSLCVVPVMCVCLASTMFSLYVRETSLYPFVKEEAGQARIKVPAYFGSEDWLSRFFEYQSTDFEVGKNDTIESAATKIQQFLDYRYGIVAEDKQIEHLLKADGEFPDVGLLKVAEYYESTILFRNLHRIGFAGLIGAFVFLFLGGGLGLYVLRISIKTRIGSVVFVFLPFVFFVLLMGALLCPNSGVVYHYFWRPMFSIFDDYTFFVSLVLLILITGILRVLYRSFQMLDLEVVGAVDWDRKQAENESC